MTGIVCRSCRQEATLARIEGEVVYECRVCAPGTYTHRLFERFTWHMNSSPPPTNSATK